MPILPGLGRPSANYSSSPLIDWDEIIDRITAGLLYAVLAVLLIMVLLIVGGCIWGLITSIH